MDRVKQETDGEAALPPRPRSYTEAGRFAGSATMGIAPATPGQAMHVLQFTDHRNQRGTLQELQQSVDAVQAAAKEVASYRAPNPDQQDRHAKLAEAHAYFLGMLVAVCPPGPERSTAISRARESKMWGSAAIAMEGH